MYQVLYRKWRPKTFEDVAGQSQVTKTLENEIKNNRINHAYLFTGSRGTGKTSCAKIFAKAVNCLNPNNGNPCGECENCKGIENGEILDVVEMDAASNRGIDDIRDIIDKAQFSPAKAKYRVYIIDEVHMLTDQAFNALLKTLEEPPEHVIFILATTEVHKIPATILSRCQRFDFHRISANDIAKRLEYVAEQESVTITHDAAQLIGAVADGAMRDALSLLDRCIALSSNVDASTVRTASGLAQKDYLYELANCCINKNCAKALELIGTLYSEAKDMARLCDELVEHFRNLMLIKTVKNPKEFLVMSEDEFDIAQTQSDYLTLEEIVYIMDILQQSCQRMGKGTSDRTELETALVKLSAPELDFSVDALLSRVASLEKAVNKGLANKTSVPPSEPLKAQEPLVESKPIQTSKPEEKVQTVELVLQNEPVIETSFEPPVAPSNPVIQETKPAPQVNTQPVSDTPKPQPTKQSGYDDIYSNAKPFLKWPEVLEVVAKYSMTLSMALKDTVAYESGNYLLVDSPFSLPMVLLQRSDNREDIRRAIEEMTGKKYKLGPYKKPEKEEQKQEIDPLETFIENAKDNGIKVIEE